MTEPAATLWTSARRDAILLTALALGVSAWGWSQILPILAAAGIVSAALYVTLVSVIHLGKRVENQVQPGNRRGAAIFWGILLFLTGGATLSLLTAALYDGFGQSLLTLAGALLCAAWQVWLYFWMSE